MERVNKHLICHAIEITNTEIEFLIGYLQNDPSGSCDEEADEHRCSLFRRLKKVQEEDLDASYAQYL